MFAQIRGLTRNFCTISSESAGSVLRTNSTQFSQTGAMFLKSAAVQARNVSVYLEQLLRSSGVSEANF